MSSSVEFDFYVQSAALEAVVTGSSVLLSEVRLTVQVDPKLSQD